MKKNCLIRIISLFVILSTTNIHSSQPPVPASAEQAEALNLVSASPSALDPLFEVQKAIWDNLSTPEQTQSQPLGIVDRIKSFGQSVLDQAQRYLSDPKRSATIDGSSKIIRYLASGDPKLQKFLGIGMLYGSSISLVVKRFQSHPYKSALTTLFILNKSKKNHKPYETCVQGLLDLAKSLRSILDTLKEKDRPRLADKFNSIALIADKTDLKLDNQKYLFLNTYFKPDASFTIDGKQYGLSNTSAQARQEFERYLSTLSEQSKIEFFQNNLNDEVKNNPDAAKVFSQLYTQLQSISPIARKLKGLSLWVRYPEIVTKVFNAQGDDETKKKLLQEYISSQESSLTVEQHLAILESWDDIAFINNTLTITKKYMGWLDKILPVCKAFQFCNPSNGGKVKDYDDGNFTLAEQFLESLEKSNIGTFIENGQSIVQTIQDISTTKENVQWWFDAAKGMFVAGKENAQGIMQTIKTTSFTDLKNYLNATKDYVVDKASQTTEWVATNATEVMQNTSQALQEWAGPDSLQTIYNTLIEQATDSDTQSLSPDIDTFITDAQKYITGNKKQGILGMIKSSINMCLKAFTKDSTNRNNSFETRQNMLVDLLIYKVYQDYITANPVQDSNVPIEFKNEQLNKILKSIKAKIINKDFTDNLEAIIKEWEQQKGSRTFAFLRGGSQLTEDEKIKALAFYLKENQTEIVDAITTECRNTITQQQTSYDEVIVAIKTSLITALEKSITDSANSEHRVLSKEEKDDFIKEELPKLLQEIMPQATDNKTQELDLTILQKKAQEVLDSTDYQQYLNTYLQKNYEPFYDAVESQHIPTAALSFVEQLSYKQALNSLEYKEYLQRLDPQLSNFISGLVETAKLEDSTYNTDFASKWFISLQKALKNPNKTGSHARIAATFQNLSDFLNSAPTRTEKEALCKGIICSTLALQQTLLNDFIKNFLASGIPVDETNTLFKIFNNPSISPEVKQNALARLVKSDLSNTEEYSIANLATTLQNHLTLNDRIKPLLYIIDPTTASKPYTIKQRDEIVQRYEGYIQLFGSKKVKWYTRTSSRMSKFFKFLSPKRTQTSLEDQLNYPVQKMKNGLQNSWFNNPEIEKITPNDQSMLGVVEEVAAQHVIPVPTQVSEQESFTTEIKEIYTDLTAPAPTNDDTESTTDQTAGNEQPLTSQDLIASFIEGLKEQFEGPLKEGQERSLKSIYENIKNFLNNTTGTLTLKLSDIIPGLVPDGKGNQEIKQRILCGIMVLDTTYQLLQKNQILQKKQNQEITQENFSKQVSNLYTQVTESGKTFNTLNDFVKAATEVQKQSSTALPVYSVTEGDDNFTINPTTDKPGDNANTILTAVESTKTNPNTNSNNPTHSTTNTPAAGSHDDDDHEVYHDLPDETPAEISAKKEREEEEEFHDAHENPSNLDTLAQDR